MAVNVSGRQLDTDEFVTDVRTPSRRAGWTPSALTLEVTETTLMRNVEETARRLTAIKELGVRIAIDDFGTGLLLARPPPAVPGRRAEDRPLVHLAA